MQVPKIKKFPHSIPAAFLLLYEKISSTSWEDKIPKERTEIVSKLEIHQSQFDCWKQSRKSIRIILLCSNLTYPSNSTDTTDIKNYEHNMVFSLSELTVKSNGCYLAFAATSSASSRGHYRV